MTARARDKNRGCALLGVRHYIASQRMFSCELFERLDEGGRAETWIRGVDLFKVAAIGDAGDTALTLDIYEFYTVQSGG